jgi:hypothetical protein
MPKLYEYLGIVLYFYAREHLPIHAKKRKEAEKFVKAYYKEITEKWQAFFVLKTEISPERISQKL